MKQLWAPWRLQYIETKEGPEHSTPGCPLCSIPSSNPPTNSKKLSTPESIQNTSLLLYKGIHTSVIMNKYPYSNGHLMVSPLMHTPDLNALSSIASTELFTITKICVNILKDCMSPEGFNIGMNMGKAAGAGIDEHLHMHVVPRWNGDCNFMPVLSEVKVMPEHLMATYKKLKPLFDRL